MSDYAEYNRLLAEAKIKALETLKRLLQTCEDPTEARRLANAILKATNSKPRKQPAPAVPTLKPVRSVPRPLPRHTLGTLYLHAESLPIAPPGDEPLAHIESPLNAPITLTPRNEPQPGGGPAGPRPLPPPLGPLRA